MPTIARSRSPESQQRKCPTKVNTQTAFNATISSKNALIEQFFSHTFIVCFTCHGSPCCEIGLFMAGLFCPTADLPSTQTARQLLAAGKAAVSLHRLLIRASCACGLWSVLFVALIPPGVCFIFYFYFLEERTSLENTNRSPSPSHTHHELCCLRFSFFSLWICSSTLLTFFSTLFPWPCLALVSIFGICGLPFIYIAQAFDSFVLH